MHEPSVPGLLREVEDLRQVVERDARIIASRWSGWIERQDFQPSADNFANYLAFRQQDIRPLQRQLMSLGISSLGRAESRVVPTLGAVLCLLRALNDRSAPLPKANPDFFVGEKRIVSQTRELLGERSHHSPVHLMVTLPTEAGDRGSDFIPKLAALGVEAVRINCAHDDEAVWTGMIGNVARAASIAGRRMKVLMDIEGPKIRTGEVRRAKGLKRVAIGDHLAITLPDRLKDADGEFPAVECTHSELVTAAQLGQRILIDDGKLTTKVVQCCPWGVVTEVLAGPDDKGYKLKAEKGVNFPEAEINISSPTDEDIEKIKFIAHHADGIEFSFVQHADDVVRLQEALAKERPNDWRELGLVLKIETAKAVRNLPDILVRAAGKQTTALMIARGDLAVEIGFARTAEIQEEILWLGEAAHVPVIWATQVLESFLKTGVPSRGEMTDAAMAARAECVMLNKGPHLFAAITEFDHLLMRMSGHITKKTPQLRPLESWPVGA